MQMPANTMKCYLRAKVQCAKDIQLQLMIGDTFTNPEFVETTRGENPTYKCLPAKCTRDGKVAGDIAVIGSDITVEPEILRDLKAHISEDECEMTDVEAYDFKVTCNEDLTQLQMLGQYFTVFLIIYSFCIHQSRSVHKS